MDGHVYERIKEEVEKAYRLTDSPEEFLAAVLRIWVEHGLYKGEISCRRGEAG